MTASANVPLMAAAHDVIHGTVSAVAGFSSTRPLGPHPPFAPHLTHHLTQLLALTDPLLQFIAEFGSVAALLLGLSHHPGQLAHLASLVTLLESFAAEIHGALGIDAHLAQFGRALGGRAEIGQLAAAVTGAIACALMEMLELVIAQPTPSIEGHAALEVAFLGRVIRT